MGLIREKRVKALTVEFTDGSVENFQFPNPVPYREATNNTVEKVKPYKEWHEHEIRWSSDHAQEV